MADVVADGYHWYRNPTGEWRQRGSQVPQFPSPREVALLDEIDRLRAEKVKFRAVAMAEAKRADELQALIDNFAAGHRGYTSHFLAAHDALLAAATKEGDRAE